MVELSSNHRDTIEPTPLNTDASIIRLKLPCDSWADFYARFAKPLARSFFVAQELSAEAGARVQVHVLLSGANLRLQGEGIARPATKGGRRGVAIQLERLEGEGMQLPLGTLDGEDDGDSFFGDAVTQASTLPEELAAQLRRSLNLRVSPSVVPRRKLAAKSSPGIDAQAADEDPPGLEEEVDLDTLEALIEGLPSDPAKEVNIFDAPTAAAPDAAAAAAMIDEAMGDDELATRGDASDDEDLDDETAADDDAADISVTARTAPRPDRQGKPMSGVTLIALGVLLGVVIGLIVGATLYLGSS